MTTLKSLLAATALVSLPVAAAQASEFNISYGVDFTTNYISKGITQTEDGPAIQPWVDFQYGLAYVGAWASNAKFGGHDDIELDLAIGVRPSIGDWDFDIGFAQYFYRDDNEDYGEAYIFANYALNDDWNLNGRYYREVYHDEDWFQLGASYSGLPWDLTLSGNIGSDFGSKDYSKDLVAVDFGVTKDISPNMGFDFRAHHSSEEGNRLIAMLSFYN